MAKLFGRERSVVTKHIRNIFKEKELERNSACAKFAHTAVDGKTYIVESYNLDMILSVGYRVNSKRGTQFRIWASQVLKNHLLRGYALNERRLGEKGLAEIESALALLSRTLSAHQLVSEQGRGVLDLIARYAAAWRLLLEYDENRLPASPRKPVSPKTSFTLSEAREAVSQLREHLASRGETSELFALERSNQFGAILATIEQTFDGKPLYPTAQERAAHLLYFLVKDHPFTDGNKRIGTLLFLEYLRRNGLWRESDAAARLTNHAVAALALLVAESEPAQKEMLVRLILNFLEDNDQ